MSVINRNKLNELLEDLRSEQNIPGISLAIRFPEGELEEFTAGVLDEKTREPVQPRHRSFSGSIGKTFTAAVVLKLLGEKDISLDQAITEYLGDESWFDSKAHALLDGVSFRMLLNHTSGLGDYVYSKRFAFDLTCRRFLKTKPLLHTPEELIRMGLRISEGSDSQGRHKYVDTGYLILGRLIERISGERYYDLLDRWFLKPLSLKSIEASNRNRFDDLMPGHLKRFNRFLLPSRLVFDGNSALKLGSEWTGGGLVGSAADFSRWVWWLVAESGLGSDIAREMMSRVETKFDESWYGLGLQIENSACGMTYGHYGWYPGYRSIARFYEDPNLAIGILVNRDVGVRIRDVADRIVGLVSK